MTGDAVQGAGSLSGHGARSRDAVARDEAPPDRLWFFRDARWRCLALGEQGIQAEPGMMEEADISPFAPAQITQLDPDQLACLDFRRARAATERPRALLPR